MSTVVAVGSVRGAPGVTTLCAAICAASNPPGVCAVDADPAGGSLGWLTGTGHATGLLTLAASAQHGPDGDSLERHLQPWGLHGRVLCAPPHGDQVKRALSTAGELLVTALRSSVRPALIDVGRVDRASAAWGLAAAADELWVVCPTTASVALALPACLGAARREGIEPWLVVVDRGPYTPEEVADYAGAPLLHVVPEDRRAAEALAGRPSAERALRRSRLWRAASALAERLTPATVERALPLPERPALDVAPEPHSSGGPHDEVTA